MARRSSTPTAVSTFAAIVNQAYVSEYFLAYRLSSGLDELYKAWDAAEREGEPTARTRVRSLSKAFDADRPTASATQPDPDAEPTDSHAVPKPAALAAQLRLNDAVLAALAWGPKRGDLTLWRADTAITVPAAHIHSTASGVLLVALDTVFADDPTTLVAGRDLPAGRLLAPLTVNDRPVATTLLEAAQVIFTADDPPTYLLGCAGGAIVLMDRVRWGEGVYLAAGLDGALARRDDAKRGELATVAALFSADSLDPGSDAQSPHDRLLDRATSESAGVNKELRHGVRRSVELLARAVVADVRNRQKGAWQQIEPDKLTRQCLRYLYRVIVLLFAEARPELAILPVDERNYRDGYGIARLRDLALVDLHSDASRNATHIQQSLEVLFRLVDGGHHPDTQLGDDVPTLTFPGLHSGLFADDACPMLDRARLDDATMQQVLANLCFTRPRAGQPRRSLSYATLGINQLGAVYEGLMAYRGRLADTEYFEVDNDGDPDTGTWLVRADEADGYLADVFVTEEGPDGQPRRVKYIEGDFIFRLAGRDRQRSASFYTPEVLTEFTVRHALDVYEEEHPDMTPADWLAMTVCEPALGSGAFANEAINQLAARYLKAAQIATGETIDPDRYAFELQKAKAHFAINRTYGVDLNRTAVELAEVSLWLNCMHEGLNAPDFSARLRRGNSLIGARRATYTPDQVATQPWKHSTANPAVAPTPRPLVEIPPGEAAGIHHFLLPGEGWGSAASAKELKGTAAAPGLAAEWAGAVNDWRKTITKKPKPAQITRLRALAHRVEAAWAQASKDTARYLAAHDLRIDVWGADDEGLPLGDVIDSGAAYRDPNGPAARLRLVMDAWCALWMWAPEHGTDLPTLDEWLDAIELLLGQPGEAEIDTLFSAVDLQDGTLDSVEYFGRARVNEVVERFSWLATCQTIADRQAFFHWELDFAPVFAGPDGGFDLQVGNPPWVRPTWNEAASLAEGDPWWGVTNLLKTSEQIKEQRRLASLEVGAAASAYRRDCAENTGLNALLAARSREPRLTGIQTNLYLNFMTNTWRRASSTGVVGLVHPESHFVDPQAGSLRQAAYRRLRRHWQFANETKLFAEVHNETEFGVHVYSGERDPSFIHAVNLLSPATADRSLDHDGSGDLPGIQFPEGGWDLRPHLSRLVTVDADVLGDWVRLFDEPGTPPECSRLLRPLTNEDLRVLEVFAQQPTRLGSVDRYWTSGFHEKGQKNDGTFEWRTEIADALGDCILQGPHILNATPFAQQPRPQCRSNKDWDAVDLEETPRDFIPRTNYQRLVDKAEFLRRQTSWDGVPYTSRYREVHREYVGAGSVRTLQSCLLPPGCSHVHAVNSVALSTNEETVIWASSLSSIPFDYLTKSLGASHMTADFISRLPMVQIGPLHNQLALRYLRLNCLNSAYASIWEELFSDEFKRDRFTNPGAVAELGDVGATWDLNTPLRSNSDRWLALCEVDALVSLTLGISEPQLVQMYRSQFPVLRKYENVTVFDGNGRQISAIHHNYGVMQAKWEKELREAPVPRGQPRLGAWDRVQAYLAGDTDVDLGPFKPPFTPADRELAMRTAYRAFAERLAES